MTTIRGHFDGRHVILDEPAPQEAGPDTPVKVVFEGDEASEVLAEIARLSTQAGLPNDFSEQHEHYIKGLPRR